MFYIELIFSLIGSLLLIICVLVSVAFLTLLELKVVGYIQIHKGPSKAGLIGVPQPSSSSFLSCIWIGYYVTIKYY